MGVPKMANREVCNVLFCEYKTKKPFLNMAYANVSTAWERVGSMKSSIV